MSNVCLSMKDEQFMVTFYEKRTDTMNINGNLL